MTHPQTDFTTALLNAELPVPAGLSDGHGQAAGKRFDVYRNNVAVSLTEALVTAFPSIHSLVGDAFFRAMAGVFLRQHPPSSPLMMFYGAEMPAFLTGFEPVAHLPYLPDVARIDLAVRHAYHAADATPIAPGALGALSPDALVATRVTLAPSVHILRSPYPAYGIWQMQHGGEKPAPQAQDTLIHRPEYDPNVTQLPPGAAAFLLALQDEHPLGAAIEVAQADSPDFDPGATLGLALTSGLFSDLT